LQEVKGWDVCDWEKGFSTSKKGHDKLVRKLKEIIKSKYHLEVRDLSKRERKELWITTWRSDGEEHYHIIFNPDIILRYGDKPEDRVFIEYVNTEGKDSQNYLRDLRGMIALECVMNIRDLKALGFVLVMRTSFCHKYFFKRPIHRFSKLRIASLEMFLNDLDRKSLRSSFDVA
jgi:hypothetical protein